MVKTSYSIGEFCEGEDKQPFGKKSLIFENWSVRKEERAGLRT
jgi:hypothetical protein